MSWRYPQSTPKDSPFHDMRIVFFIFLFVAAAPAWAQWVKEDDAEHPINYIDSASIRQVDQFRRVWVTQYLRFEGPDDARSRRALLEFDCEGRRFRYLSTTKNSEPDPSTQARSSQGSAPKQSGYIPAAIDYQRVHRIVCARK
jgi:hypothetical protein